MFTPNDGEIVPATPEEMAAIEAEMERNPLVTVFVVKNPGWASDMVLENIDAVLENIRVELGEMWEGDALEFTISMEQYTRKQLDELEEFEG